MASAIMLPPASGAAHVRRVPAADLPAHGPPAARGSVCRIGPLLSIERFSGQRQSARSALSMAHDISGLASARSVQRCAGPWRPASDAPAESLRTAGECPICKRTLPPAKAVPPLMACVSVCPVWHRPCCSCHNPLPARLRGNQLRASTSGSRHKMTAASPPAMGADSEAGPASSQTPSGGTPK
jgi:hypothetical protein